VNSRRGGGTKRRIATPTKVEMATIGRSASDSGADALCSSALS
jgi:hypothetical protein